MTVSQHSNRSRRWRNQLRSPVILGALLLLVVLAAALQSVGIRPTLESSPSDDSPSQKLQAAPGVTEAALSQRIQAPIRNAPHTISPAVGLNKVDLFLQYLGLASGGDGSNQYRTVTQAMAQKAIADAANSGVPYLRISATGYWPRDLDLWRESPAAYWELFDVMIADLSAHNVRMIPVFLWNWTQFAAMSGETASDTIANPDSDSYRLLERYVVDFVERYRAHPALYMYDVTNELNLYADLDVVARCSRGEVYPRRSCRAAGNFTTDEMNAFMTRLAALIRSYDPDHLISSGFSLPRRSAEHLRKRPEFSPGGPDNTEDSLEEFQRHLLDIHAGLEVVSVHFYNTDGNNERFGVRGRASAELVELIKETTDEAGKPLFIGEFGGPGVRDNDGVEALFTQNVLAKIVELRIPYSAAWVWQYYQTAPYATYDTAPTTYNLEPGYTDLLISEITQANEQLGFSDRRAYILDTVPPQIVLTWPLAQSEIACEQLIHAVASDNSGTLAKVVFLIDGNVATTVVNPPYQFRLDTTRLSSSSHMITAEAYDVAGNVARVTITTKTQMCLLDRFSHLLDSLSFPTTDTVDVDARRHPTDDTFPSRWK